MKVLVACEENQRVTIELRKLGHEAYSCDIEPCSGGHPEWHYQGDVVQILSPRKNMPFSNFPIFILSENDAYIEVPGRWDMIIAFPPCTYLTNAGTRHFSRRINPEHKVAARELLRLEAFEFFMLFANADCDKIAIENPVGWVNSHFRKPNQIVHPYYFGENYKKRTCLWLKGLDKLEPTNMLPVPEPEYICQGPLSKGKAIGWCEGIKNTTGGQKGRAKARSKTFPEIAKAMADQWAKE